MKTYKQFTEGMLPEPSRERKQIINPMPPKEPVEVKVKEQGKKISKLEKDLKGYQKK